MYKGIFIIISIIIIIVFFNFITQNYTKAAVAVLEDNLEKMRLDFLGEEKDEKKIKNDIDIVFEEWYKRYNILAYYIEHDELEKVENDLTMVRSCIEAGTLEEGIEHINTSIFLMNHIKEKETFSLKNIF